MKMYYLNLLYVTLPISPCHMPSIHGHYFITTAFNLAIIDNSGAIGPKNVYVLQC